MTLHIVVIATIKVARVVFDTGIVIVIVLIVTAATVDTTSSAR